MATYKDDLDIMKAAAKADVNKLTFNAITELDNMGLLGRYGGSGSGDMWPGVPIVVMYTTTVIPYSDVPDWARASSENTYLYIRVLKCEPVSVPSDAVAVIYYDNSTYYYYGDSLLPGETIYNDPILSWTDDSGRTTRVNTATKEAFKIVNGK